MKHAILLAALLIAPTLANATGLFQCEPTDRGDWMSETRLTEHLVAAGWNVRRMKEDGGCREVYGTTPDGRRVEGYFHPVSGQQLLLNQRGRIIFQAD